MSTIKNGQILLCHFNKIMKEPGTNFQSPAFCQKHVRNVCHTAHQYLTKFHFDRTQNSKEISISVTLCSILMMTSRILKSAGFTKTKKSRHLENETLFFLQIKKIISYTFISCFMTKNGFVAQVTFKVYICNNIMHKSCRISLV